MRAALVTLTMCLLALPANAKYSGGTGEPNDPYQIATAADLIALGETPEDYDKHFILTADIDLDPNLPGRKVFDKAVIAPASNVDVSPWVEGTPFKGVFDGDGRKISHLTIVGGYRVYGLGLFGRLESGAEVRNLRVADVNVVGSSRYIGALVEFYVRAVTSAHGSRCWPAPTGSDAGHLTNALYQVDDSFDENATWIPGSQPVYYLVMTAAEKAQLEKIWATSTSDAPMNGTFISREGTGIRCR